jgi:hypothetical protein
MNTVFTKLAIPALLVSALAAPIAASASQRSDSVVARLTDSRILDNGFNQRLNRQQHRIDQGIRSRELSPRETGRLENREYRLRMETSNNRLDHGGRLTRSEHRRLERQINRTSGAILALWCKL